VWAPAYDADNAVRDGAWVAELTGLLDLAGWPPGMHVISRMTAIVAESSEISSTEECVARGPDVPPAGADRPPLPRDGQRSQERDDGSDDGDEAVTR
jgi:hypothetical protein